MKRITVLCIERDDTQSRIYRDDLHYISIIIVKTLVYTIITHKRASHCHCTKHTERVKPPKTNEAKNTL